ncbi:MobF family relaxase [Streptomyces sp. NPDC005318]|uniref:MobF family relaxase n=1 Tax=Streptomyces sp. NPDC005318 TaxID=3157031 RepID=UPI0033ABB853
MAWLTRITADEQVEYRLREQAGCSVVEAPAAETVALEAAGDEAVDHRLRTEADAVLVWIGTGLSTVGLVDGAVLDEEGKDAARRLMNGCHPATGARLIRSRTSARAHEKAKLTTARLTEAIEAAAAKRDVEPADLLEGKPKQQKVLATQQRMVHRFGEMHRIQVGTLHKLARAAGIDLADVYGETELAEAWAHKDVRVDDRVRGWDLVLDLPKSDSVLQGFMGSLDERELCGLVHQAKRDMFAQLESWVGYAVGSEDGQPVRIATGGLMAWSVEHQAARPMGDGQPGDPHLHLHVTIPNLALCQDGRWRSIANSGQDLHRHASALDAFFKARVRALTYERFGVRREQNERTAAWEIVGIPEHLREEFSRRAALVDATAGADASREEKAAVSLQTKRAKHAADATTMRDSWRQRAEGLGVDVDAMVLAAAPGPPGPGDGPGVDGPGNGPRTPPPSDLAAIVFDPDTGLTRSEKSFSRAQLLAALANALEYGIDDGPGRLDELADQVLAVEGYAVPVPAFGSTVMSSTARYTTQDILDAEDVVTRQVLARVDEGTAVLSPDEVERAITTYQRAVGYELSGQQCEAFVRLLTAGHGIDTVVGIAGAGKSTLMEACRIGWDAVGTTYEGACLSAVAAQNLASASAIPSRTVAAWLERISRGKGLAGIDVLVLDEATMVDDRSAALLMSEAARTGTKIVGIGDHLQLQAIGVGGWFREAHRLVHGLTLTENYRQEDAAERQALEVWRTGDHEQALNLLAAGGRVHAAGSADEARSQILTAWDELRGRWPDMHDLIAGMVVLAARNTDVDVFNVGAQQIRRAAGELGAERTFALPGGHQLTLAVGDAVRVRANDYRARRGQGPDLLNGYRAVVTAIDDERRVQISWRLKGRGGKPREESAWLSPDQIASGALSLGYAMTIAASQGMTVDTSLMYGHGANAFATYPGITRARSENHLWLPLAVLEDETTQARLGAARSEKELLQRAVRAFAQYLGQSRPDGMISDLLREPPTPAVLPVQATQERPVVHGPPAERAAAAGAVLPYVEQAEREQAHRAPVRREQPVPERALDDETVLELSEDRQQQLAEFQRQRAMRAIPSWTDRPYGTMSDADLCWKPGDALQRAKICDQGALQDGEEARVLAERLAQEKAHGQTKGQRRGAEVIVLLDHANGHLRTAREELGQAVLAQAAVREANAALERLEANNSKGRVALRLASTSKKEHQELTECYRAQRAAGWSEGSRATSAANTARTEAWDTIRGSEFADVFREMGATQPAPRDIDDVARKLAAMRAHVPAFAQRVDTKDLKQLARLHGQVTKYRNSAAIYRENAALMVEEQALRRTVAEKYGELHTAETRGRDLHKQQQAAASVRHEPGYQPPAPSRSGPSRGL